MPTPILVAALVVLFAETFGRWWQEWRWRRVPARR